MPRSEALALALAVAASAAAADAPSRVVSINLCPDQLALHLAAPGQLVSVSWLAADPRSSALAEAASAYPLNRGGLEEIVALAPDLVLAGTFSDPFVLSGLDRLGIPVHRVPIVTALDGIAPEIRRMGAALCRADEAARLAAAVEARLAALPPSGQPGRPGPVLAFFGPGGWSAGPGTLAHDIAVRAGFESLAARLGMAGGGYLSLEDLLWHRPDVVVTSAPYPGHSEAEALLAHPALAEAGYRVLDSGPAWSCGTPETLDALAGLAAIAADLPED